MKDLRGCERKVSGGEEAQLHLEIKKQKELVHLSFTAQAPPRCWWKQRPFPGRGVRANTWAAIAGRLTPPWRPRERKRCLHSQRHVCD